MSGWREVLEDAIQPHVSSDLYDEGVFVNYPAIGDDILAMPPEHRLALARELLAGTGWVVAREVNESGSDNGVRIPDAPDWATTGSERGSWEMGWSEGWNACRAAMLGDKP